MAKFRSLLLMTLIPLLALAIACSSDDDGDSSPGAEPSATSADSQQAGDGNSNGDSTPDNDNDADADVLANCPELLSFVTSAGAGAAGVPGSVAGAADLTAEYFQNLADNAPGEIKDDLLVIANAYGEFLAALDDLGIDLSNPTSLAGMDPETAAQLEEALSAIDTAEVEQAGMNIEQYFEENCS